MFSYNYGVLESYLNACLMQLECHWGTVGMSLEAIAMSLHFGLVLELFECYWNAIGIIKKSIGMLLGCYCNAIAMTIECY